jgi:hypothetical protein
MVARVVRPLSGPEAAGDPRHCPRPRCQIMPLTRDVPAVVIASPGLRCIACGPVAAFKHAPGNANLPIGASKDAARARRSSPGLAATVAVIFCTPRRFSVDCHRRNRWIAAAACALIQTHLAHDPRLAPVMSQFEFDAGSRLACAVA